MIAAASMVGLAVSAAEASAGRLMRSPDAHPPTPSKLTAAEKKASQKAADAEKRAIERTAAAPRRSAANTGAIESAVATAQRTPQADDAASGPVVDKDGNTWPSWRYGPNGESGIFNSAAEVPKGWQDHPGAFDL